VKILYVDSSVVVSYYLPSELRHSRSVELIDDPDTAVVTSRLTQIEVTGALVRAARAGRVTEAGNLDPTSVIDRFNADLAGGPITLVGADQAEIELVALDLVRSRGIRALDALHVAVASIVLPDLTGPGDEALFATRDTEQADAATACGLLTV
jgi:uncharacterized protein